MCDQIIQHYSLRRYDMRMIEEESWDELNGLPTWSQRRQHTRNLHIHPGREQPSRNVPKLSRALRSSVVVTQKPTESLAAHD